MANNKTLSERIVDSYHTGKSDPTELALILAFIAEITATADEINQIADISTRVLEITASATVAPGIQSLELNHATVVIEAVITNSAQFQGLFIVKNTSSGGTAAHTLTLTNGTFNGTNSVATLDAPNEALVIYFDSNGEGTIIENVGAVGLV